MAMLLRQSEISSPAYKMRKIVTTSSTNQGTPVNTTASTYQRALKHSTGSRIVGIPKHLRQAMKLRRAEQERIKGDEKSGTVKVTDDDDNEPYRVSQTSLSGARQGDNGRRRLMPPLHPKLQPYRRVDSPGSSAAPTPSRSRFAQQKQNRKVIPPVNSNKRTRTGLSPALRALGFDDGDNALLPPDIRRNKTLPPELSLDGGVEESGDETKDKDMKYSQSSSEKRRGCGDAEDALNPMMLADNGQDSGEDTHSSDGAPDDEDGEESISTQHLLPQAMTKVFHLCFVDHRLKIQM